jgi:hypothetical protein
VASRLYELANRFDEINDAINADLNAIQEF